MRVGIRSIAVLLALSGIAHASTISGETLTGIIISGTDSAGDLGGGSLAGDSITLSFDYDPALLVYQGGLDSEGLERSTYGFVLNESVTINTYIRDNPRYGHLFCRTA